MPIIGPDYDVYATVTVNELPEVVLATPEAICDGQATRIEVQTVTGGTPSYGYSWDGGQTFGGSGYLDTGILSEGEIRYSVIVRDANGCTASDETSVVVNENIMPTFDDYVACNGDSQIILPSESENSITGTWSPAVVDMTRSDIYTFTPNPNFCALQTSVYVTIQDRPTASVSGSTAICAGNTIDQQITIEFTGAAPYSYSWTDGADTYFETADENTVTLDVNPENDATYSVLSLVDGNGCAANDLLTSATILVHDRPTATVSGGDEVCADYSGGISLTMNFTGSSPFTYTWSDGANTTTSTSAESIVTLPVHPSVSTTYTIVSLSDVNCAAIDVDMTGEAVVTVNTLPVVTLMQPEDICYGTNSIIEIESISEASSPLTYSWNGGVFGQSDVYDTGVLIEDAEVSLTVRDANGCTGGDAVTVIVKPLPEAAATSATICYGGTASLSAEPAGADSYEWSGGLGSGMTVSATPESTSTYTVTVTVDGCSKAAESTVTVNPNPTVTIRRDRLQPPHSPGDGKRQRSYLPLGQRITRTFDNNHDGRGVFSSSDSAEHMYSGGFRGNRREPHRPRRRDHQQHRFGVAELPLPVDLPYGRRRGDLQMVQRPAYRRQHDHTA